MLGFRAIAELAIAEGDVLAGVPPPPPDPDVPTPKPPPSPDDPPVAPPPPTILPTVTQRYASHSFVTRPTDTPSQKFIAGRLNSGVTVGRRVNAGPDGQFGGLIVASFGELEFANNDGALDFLADDFFVDGRKIVIKAGRTEIDEQGREVIWPFASFTTVYTATAGAWTIEHDALKLRVRDQGINLQRQLQLAVYGGTGGQQGTSDMEGRTLPVCLGRCFNIQPQQVDPVYLTYQVHDSSVQAIPAVYDAGISVPGEVGSPPIAQDYATYPLLVAATMVPGTYATCLARGCFRLGTSPFGTVTADVDGDNTGNDWTATHGTVMLRILRKYSWLPEALIDAPSFTAYHALNNDVIGLYLPAGDQSTIEQVMERIAFSGGAVAGQDRSGLYRVVRLDPPAATIAHDFSDRNILRIERQPLAYGVPFRSWTVEGVRNWTVQQGNELAGGVSQSRRRFLEAETRKSSVDVPHVSSAHPTSASAIRESLFHFISNASDEAVRLATLYALGRASYRLTVKGVLFEVGIGDTVRITYPRWNLTEGRNFVVTAVTDDARSVETELEIFG